MCYDEGMIQAYIDGELSPKEIQEVCKHLETCEICRDRFDDLKKIDAFVKGRIALKEISNPLNSEMAWERFRRKLGKKSYERQGVFYMMRKYKKLLSGTAAAVLISSAIWVAPVRDAAADFLSIFRVSQFKTVTLTYDDLASIQDQLEEKGLKDIDLKQYGKIKIDGGEMKKEYQIDDGSSLDKALKSIEDEVGISIFPPEAPKGFKLTNIRVSNPARIDITPDVKNLNQLISTFGGSAFFPEALDGKKFTISINNDILLLYESSSEQEGVTQDIIIQKTKLPDIHVPDGVDMDAVRHAVISLPFIPENLRKQLADIKDWKTTLPVPVGEDTDVKEINVNGNRGVFMSVKHIDSVKHVDFAANTVIWSDGEFMYWLASSLPEDKALQMAESLR